MIPFTYFSLNTNCRDSKMLYILLHCNFSLYVLKTQDQIWTPNVFHDLNASSLIWSQSGRLYMTPAPQRGNNKVLMFVKWIVKTAKVHHIKLCSVFLIHEYNMWRCTQKEREREQQWKSWGASGQRLRLLNHLKNNLTSRARMLLSAGINRCLMSCLMTFHSKLFLLHWQIFFYLTTNTNVILFVNILK